MHKSVDLVGEKDWALVAFKCQRGWNDFVSRWTC